jgi:hypothetical protein
VPLAGGLRTTPPRGVKTWEAPSRTLATMCTFRCAACSTASVEHWKGGTATKTVAHIGLTRSVKECKRRRNASKDDLVSRCACLSRSSVHIRRRAVVCVTVTPGADTHRVDERCTGVDIKCSSRSEGAEPDWTVRASGRGCQRGCLGGAGAVEQRLVGREGPITAGPLVPAVGRIVMLSQHVSCEGEDATLSTSSKRCKGVLSAMHVWSLKTC